MEADPQTALVVNAPPKMTLASRSFPALMLKIVRHLVIAAALSTLAPPTLAAQEKPVTLRDDSVMIRLVDAELRAAVQALGRYLDRPVVFGAMSNARITLETPQPVPGAQVVNLLRGLLESQNFELVADSGLYRVRSRDVPDSFGSALPRSPRGSPAPGNIRLFVIRLRHARASDVAATVNALYGRASALGELGGQPPTLSEELQQNQVLPFGDAGPQGGVAGIGRAALSGEITIVPDSRTNSLLIRASPNDFALIRAAVDQIDVRPLQVLIEVVIAEVRRDRALAFGVGAELPPVRIPGATDRDVSASTAGIGLGDFALEVVNLGGVDLDVTLRAAATRGDVTILSRPVLFTANNEQAQILVGSQCPFVQVQRGIGRAHGPAEGRDPGRNSLSLENSDPGRPLRPGEPAGD